MAGCGFALDLLLVCFRMRVVWVIWFGFVGLAVYGCLLCTVADVV